MEVSKYNQMMAYLTRPRERFGDGGITLNKKGPYKGFYAITLKRGGKNITFRDKDINVVKQKVKEFEATRPPTGGAAVKTKRKVEGISEKNLTRLREIITNKAKERNLPPPNFEKYPGRGYPSNTPGNIMAKDLIRGIKKTGTRGGKDFKTVGTGTGSKALTDPLSKPEKELLEKTFTNVDFDFTKSRFGIDRKVNPELYRQAVNLVKENPKLVFGFQFMKPENYLLTTFQRARLQQLADTGVSEYVPIYKNQKIIGFQDNTEAGGGKKFYHADYKGGTSIKTHPNFEKVAKYVDIVKDTRGDHIPLLNKLFTDVGEKVPTFDQLLNNLLDSPGRGGAGSISAAIEKHHTKGVKTSTADLQLLTRDKNKLAALIEGRVDSGKMDFETANRILKPEGIQIEREGVKIGAPDISPEKQVEDLKKFVTRKTLEKFAGNLDDPLAIRLATLGCPGKAMGGRIGFQEGTTPTVRCVQAGANIVNEGNVKNLTQGQRRNLSGFLNKAYKLGRNVAKFGVVPEAIFVAGESLLRVGMGDTLDEAFLRATDYLRTGDQTLEADASKISRTLFDQDAGNLFKSVSNFRKTKKDLEGAQVNLQADLAQNIPEFSGMSDEDIRKIGEDRIKKAKDDFFNAQIAKEQQVLSDYQFEQGQDISKAQSYFTAQKLKGKQMGAIEDDPLQIDLTLAPEQKQSPLLDVRSILTQTPESIADEINKSYQSGVYGQTGLEESREKAVNDYSKTLQQFFNIKSAPLSSLAASPVVGIEQIYGANPENFLQKRLPAGASFDQRLAYDFAGGGIAKLAGVDSGPPPEKGPTPQGLDFLLKRGR
jgi:hypothetical protein